jgi:hypothetical protein
VKFSRTILGVVVAVIVAGLPGVSPVAANSKVSPIRLLNALPVSSEMGAGYSRELFRHWSDLDRDGCDTREEVLIEERVTGAVQGCRVINGTWFSSFDGVTTNNPTNFDIDHFVPLKEAWDSGAWRWNANTRERFANDLAYPRSLIAVTASSNRSKSDRDPTDWLPKRQKCEYAKSWVAVKFRWRLSVDTREKSALTQILRNCSGKIATPPLASIGIGSASTKPNDSAGSDSTGKNDPRFATCGEAIAAGFGPYQRGKDPEYDWYVDRDSDGTVCE